MTVARDWTSPGTSLVVGKYRIDDFGRFFSDPLREGRASVIEDASTDPRVSRPMYESSWRSIGVRSTIAYPLVKGGQFVAAIFVHGRDARTWSASEVALVSEVGERTWGAIERHRAEAALGESEEKYRTLFESIDEGFCIVEVLFGGPGEPVDHRFLESNPAFERHSGLHNVAGKRMRELEPRHEEHWFETYGRIVLTGEPERFQNAAEYLGVRYFDVYAFHIGAPEERKVAIIFTNITRRKEEEEERLRLRALEASAQSEASERQRIGRELHDRVAHTMGVAHQSLQLHRAYAASDPERAAEKLELAADATKTALNQTRDLSAQLARRGVKETSDGLGSALSELLAFYVPDGVETKLSVEGDESAVSAPVGDEMYLIMREAVRNAVEHSGAGALR